MSKNKTPIQPKQKIGLAMQLIGVTMLFINIYYAGKTGESNTIVLVLGLTLVIGGMFIVLRNKVKS